MCRHACGCDGASRETGRERAERCHVEETLSAVSGQSSRSSRTRIWRSPTSSPAKSPRTWRSRMPPCWIRRSPQRPSGRADAAAGAWQRKAVLKHLAARCRERAEELAEVLVVEAGKPIQFARAEVARLIDTLESRPRNRRGSTAKCCRSISPSAPPATAACGSACRSGRARSSRRGIFRSTWWPTRSRRRSPAAARSCSSRRASTPIGALILGEILAETDLPAGAFSILPLKSSDRPRSSRTSGSRS